jgi:hypothetical protein
MSSSWPILFGMIAVVFAAFWYDASVATAAAQTPVAAPAMVPAPHAFRQASVR